MEGLKATLECIYQVNIDIGFNGDDIWNIETGERIECKICDNGIQLKINENCWSAIFKPSEVQKYFKIVE
jgi:hypothetical protein